MFSLSKFNNYNNLGINITVRWPVSSGFSFLYDVLQLETRNISSTDKVIFWSIVHVHVPRAGLGGSVGCAVRLDTRRSRVQLPPRSATFFRGAWSWNIFYGHSLPSADSRLIVLGFNDTSTLEGHFVSSPREREKRDRRESRGDEREGQGRKRNRNESEETEEIKTFPLYPYPLQG